MLCTFDGSKLNQHFCLRSYRFYLVRKTYTQFYTPLLRGVSDPPYLGRVGRQSAKSLLSMISRVLRELSLRLSLVLMVFPVHPWPWHINPNPNLIFIAEQKQPANTNQNGKHYKNKLKSQKAFWIFYLAVTASRLEERVAFEHETHIIASPNSTYVYQKESTCWILSDNALPNVIIPRLRYVTIIKSVLDA